MSQHNIDALGVTRNREFTEAAEAVVLGGKSELSLDDAVWLAERAAGGAEVNEL